MGWMDCGWADERERTCREEIVCSVECQSDYRNSVVQKSNEENNGWEPPTDVQVGELCFALRTLS